MELEAQRLVGFESCKLEAGSRRRARQRRRSPVTEVLVSPLDWTDWDLVLWRSLDSHRHRGWYVHFESGLCGGGVA